MSRLLSTIVRTAAAAAAAVLAVAVSAWLRPYLLPTPNAPLYIVTCLAAWRGGLLGGLVAAGIAAAAVPLRPDLATLGTSELVTQQVTLGAMLGLVAVIVGGLSWSERRSRERLVSTLASVGDAVFVTDTTGHVTDLNPAAETLVGWSLRDARGRALEDVVPLVDEETGEPESIHVDATLREGRSLAIGPGLVVLTRHGDKAPVDGTVNPMCDPRGRPSGAVVVLRDITVRYEGERERRRLSQEVAASRERLQQIMGSVPAIMWEAWGAPGPDTLRLRFISQYLETLTGYTTDEALTTPNFFLEHMHPDDRDSAIRSAAGVFRSGESAVSQFRWRARDGRELWLEMLSFPVRDPKGRPVGLRGVCIDISARMRQDADRNELLARERQARQDAEEANRLKDEFLMTLSHELRTPLNAILGWACLLRDSDLPADKQRRAIETIERNARAQTQLIEDLLDMSRIVSGKVRLEIGTVDLATVVQGLVEAMRPGAEAKGVRLDLVPDPDIERIPGDADRIQQVIWNLVSNAIKFTPAGGRVEVRVRQLYDRVLVAVSDTGIGIVPDLLPYIFERFRQGAQGGGGLGLGLAIAKQIVELHGGTVEARSLGENMGATFLVKLPLYTKRPFELVGGAAGVMAPEQPSDAAEGDLTGLRVLVVDAASDSRELLQLMLERAGATVATAASGRDAFALVGTWNPHALVCDLSGPDNDDFELIRGVRAAEAREHRPSLPAVAISAFARSDDRRAALESGFDDHLTKPVSSPQLVTTVRSALGKESQGFAGGRAPVA